MPLSVLGGFKVGSRSRSLHNLLGLLVLWLPAPQLPLRHVFVLLLLTRSQFALPASCLRSLWFALGLSGPLRTALLSLSFFPTSFWFSASEFRSLPPLFNCGSLFILRLPPWLYLRVWGSTFYPPSPGKSMSSCSLLIWLQNGSGMWSAEPSSGDRGLLLLDYSEHIFLDLWYGIRARQSVWVSFS